MTMNMKKYQYQFNQSSIQYLKGLQYVLGMLTMNSQLNPITNQQILLFCAISIVTPILFAYILKLFLDSSYYQEQYQMNDFFIEYKVNSDMKPLIYSDPNPKNHMNQVNYVRKHSVLSNYFKGYEMDKLEHFTKEVKYSPNDKIIIQSNTDDCSLYFLLEGNAKAISKTGEFLGQLEPMQAFGEISFFTLQNRSATIISENFSTLLKVNLQEFLDRLTSIEKEQYYIQKDQILMESIYPQKCYSCHHNTHTITDCPTLTYKPDRYKVMRRFIREQKQKRTQYLRKRIKKSSSSLKGISKLNDLIDRFNDLYSELVVQTSNLSSVSNLPYDETVMADASYTRIIDREKDKTIKLSNIFKLRSINNEEEDSSQDFLVNRGDSQKHTLSTAGFPNIGSQKHHRDTLNVILEQDSLEAQSQFEDEIGRNEDQKLSIIQHLEENQSDYNIRRSQNQNQTTLLVKQHSRQNSKKNSVDSWACSPIIKLPMKGRQQSRSSTNSQKSTMQFTNRFSAIPMQGNNEEILIDRDIEHFERMHLMTIFHPHNNYDVVIDIQFKEKETLKLKLCQLTNYFIFVLFCVVSQEKMYCSNQEIQITYHHPESQINSSRQLQSFQQFQLSNPSFKYPPKPIAQEPSIISEQDIQSKSQYQYYHSNKQVPNNTLIRNAYEDSSDLPKYIRQKSKSINFTQTRKQYQQLYDICENASINTTRIEQQQCTLFLQNIINIWNYLYFISIQILLIYIPIQNYYQQYDQDDSYIMVFISIKLIDILLLIIKNIDPINFNQKLISNLNDYYKQHLIYDFIQLITLSMQFISSINSIYQFILLILILFTLKTRYITLRTNLTIPCKFILFPIIDLITYINCLVCIYAQTIDQPNQNNYLQSISKIISIITLQSNYQPTNDTEIIIYALLQLFSLIPLVYIFKLCSTAIDQIKVLDNCTSITNNEQKYFKILKSYFNSYSDNSLQKCTQYLQTIQTKTNEAIIQRGPQTDPSIYFILQGKYSIITNQNQQLAKLSQYFGEISFFTDQPSQCIINSDTDGVLLKLQLTHFIHCLDDLDKQTYLNMRNQILFQQRYPSKCSCCKSFSHNISQCPKLTYIPNRLDILNQHSLSTVNHRQPFFKRSRHNRDMHSLQFYKFAQLKLQEFVELFSENIAHSSIQTSNNRLPYEDEIQSSSPCQGDYHSDNQISFHLEQFNDRSSNQIDHEEVLQIPRKQSDERPYKINSINKIQPKSFRCLESILEQDSFENILQSQQFMSKQQYELQKHRTSIGTDIYLSQQKLKKQNKQQNSMPKSPSFQQFSTIPIMQQSTKQNLLFQQNLSLEYDCHLQFDIDKMRTFKLFQPHHNYDQAIFDYNNQKHF